MSLVELVINGKKPGAFVNLKENVDHPNMDFVETGSWTPRGIRPPNQYAISRKEVSVADIVFPNDLENYRDMKTIYERLLSLYPEIGKLNVHFALKLLNEQPREDDVFTRAQKLNLERPEAAILEGHLLGYESCDIIYYIKTRYLNEQKHELDTLENLSAPIKCYNCMNS